MYKCCIFDLDETLVNSIHAVQKLVSDTLSYWSMREVNMEGSRLHMGDDYKKLLEQSFIACGDKELTHYEEAVERYQDIFREYCMYCVEACGGIGEFLEFLKSQGIFIMVLFNRPHPRTLSNVWGAFGKGYFDLVYGEREDKGIKKKPRLNGVWAIAEGLRLPKSGILYLGGTSTGMETEDNARMDAARVAWGFRTEEELTAFHPALIADHPSQVTQYIKSANKTE